MVFILPSNDFGRDQCITNLTSALSIPFKNIYKNIYIRIKCLKAYLNNKNYSP